MKQVMRLNEMFKTEFYTLEMQITKREVHGWIIFYDICCDEMYHLLKNNDAFPELVKCMVFIPPH